MQMVKKSFFLAIVFGSYVFSQVTTIDTLKSSLMDINNFELWVSKDGRIGFEGNSYPAGTANVLYSDGFIWGGKVNDGISPILRVGGQCYYSATNPGPVTPIPDSLIRIYRIRKDYLTADLRFDASRLWRKSQSAVTTEEINTLRSRYAKDWKEWPVSLGAPYQDKNGNGVFDTGDVPGLLDTDQVIWFVGNDLQADTGVFHSPKPVGIEMQTTLWAYANYQTTPPQTLPLVDILFKRVKLIYKGLPGATPGSRVDSMFVGQWSDPDIGNAGNDYLGCDTVRQLAYAYNSVSTDASFDPFGIKPPVVGYVLLQGPLVPGSSGDSGVWNFKKRSGYKNLSISSFWAKIVGTSYNSSPVTLGHWWKALRGFVSRDGVDQNHTVPTGYPETKFPFSGDPVAGTGFAFTNASLAAQWRPPGGDAKFMLNTGPFTMALGDTQEVVFAMIGGAGPDYLSNITIMKNRCDMVAYDYPSIFSSMVTGIGSSGDNDILPKEYVLSQNFPNPFNPETRIKYDLPVNAYVQLAIYDLLGREVIKLEDAAKSAGSYSVLWDGRNKSYQPVPSGVYIYRMTAGHIQISKKMVLVR